MYNKLFTKILDSSIWLEPVTTRIVWITLIAAMDEDGYAHFSAIENLALRARVTLEECNAAVTVLSSPDPNSENPDNDGRRIERVPGGFLILNAKKYRGMLNAVTIRESTRLRVARHRASKAGNNGSVTQALPSVTSANATALTLALEGESEREVRTKLGHPTIEECRAMAVEAGMPESEGDSFFYSYDAKGWVCGMAKTPMKNPKSAMANWRKGWKEGRYGGGVSPQPSGGVAARSVSDLRLQKQVLEEKIVANLEDKYIDDQWVKRPKSGKEEEVKGLRAKLREVIDRIAKSS